MRASSPHTHTRGDTGRVMRTVIFACIPGIIALSVYFGFGSLVNIVLLSAFCAGFEACAMSLRKRRVAFYLKDYSAVLTGVLLGIALPPYAPWWLLATGAFFAIVVAKQLYGGLGSNPFNPAMVGYVVLLISFPLEMTQWISPHGLLGQIPSLGEGLAQVFLNGSVASVDGYTGATPLDVVKQNTDLLLDDLFIKDTILSTGGWAGAGWEWVNLGFLIGGIYLLYRKIFTWHAPLGMLAGITLFAALFYDGGSSTSGGSPLFHLFSGATMFGAFFIATDPVSSAVSTRGRLIYGFLIGVFVYCIRVWGNYPDAVAFAVLLMNFAAPFIDYYTLPRAYGHSKAGSGRGGKSN